MINFNLEGREFIELYKLLKVEGIASSGGKAKAVIAAGQVLLNGVKETQKRKKIVAGDQIKIGTTTINTQLKESTG